MLIISIVFSYSGNFMKFFKIIVVIYFLSFSVNGQKTFIHAGRLIDGVKDIPIEKRDSEELSHIEGLDEKGDIKKVLIYPKKSKSMNLAFDVTPAKYVTGLITEKGICEASEDELKKLLN